MRAQARVIVMVPASEFDRLPLTPEQQRKASHLLLDHLNRKVGEAVGPILKPRTVQVDTRLELCRTTRVYVELDPPDNIARHKAALAVEDTLTQLAQRAPGLQPKAIR